MEYSENEIEIIKQLHNSKQLAKVYSNKNEWNGCFGMMTVISLDTIDNLQEKHHFPCGLVNVITNREQRMALERIIGLLQSIYGDKNSLFGDIHTFIQLNYKLYGYDGWSSYFLPQYLSKEYLSTIPIIKVWSAR